MASTTAATLASTAEQPSSLIVGLRLSNKKAAVFGQGSSALTRATFALDAGASVVLYSSESTPAVPKALGKWAEAGRITTVAASKYQSNDISAFSVVFVADSSAGINVAEIVQAAHTAGVPVNVAGNVALSDFTLMPTYHGQGGLQVAVTTNGVAPRVAQRLLKEIVGKLPSGLESQLSDVARLNAAAAAVERERQTAVAKLESAVDSASPGLSTAVTAAHTPAPESVIEEEPADLGALRSGAAAVVDVQAAAAYAAHALSDLCFVYAAPEQALGAAALAWSRRAEKNAFGEWVSALRMQTRAGAGHALWGALASGARVAAIASAESLPHMAPVLTELVDRRQPLVVHASAESMDASGENHTDQADALAALQTGAVLLASASPQEAHDVAVIAHAVAAAAAVPVVHIVSAATGSEQIRTASHKQLADFVASVAKTHSGQAVAEIIDAAFTQFRGVFGRTYSRFEYSGSADAETVFVALGQPAADAVESLPALLREKVSVGVLSVRGLRPWGPEQLAAALPTSARRVVLLRCARDAATADALVAEVALATLVGRPAAGICVSSANVFGIESASGIAEAMRGALGLESAGSAEELAEEQSSEEPADAAAAAVASDSDAASAEPTAIVSTALDIAKKLAFPEAYGAELVARPGERTFAVRVSTKYRMTPETYDRNIFHIEFDTRGTDLTYEIGDALGVYGCNDSAQVAEFCQQYGLDPEQLVTAARDGEQHHTRTVRAWLTHALDLFGRPSKGFYTALADCATDQAEAEKLRWLTTSEGAVEFRDRVADTVTYADLLLEFGSARPSFLRLVDLIAPIKPRHYSIASSAKMHPGS
ncbi:sulfite reductase [NADPH] flavoprotein component, partial [Coemansia sp. RSA 485]